jgi:VIT1/CCC1 family predicted Fe2+/Mn2+ transporter
MPEFNYVSRAGWLRAAVLGANDGIVSTASLILGVAAADGTRSEILIAALAGWAAGAMSMAAGQYVSVSSQADSEAADLAREERALRESPTAETLELAKIYERRGLARDLAGQVAAQLMAKDALAAHARDELGLAEGAGAHPTLAAFAAAAAYSLGAVLPTLAAFSTTTDRIVVSVPATAMSFLAVLGALGAWAGGAPVLKPALRGVISGALAMAVTATIGDLVGKAI